MAHFVSMERLLNVHTLQAQLRLRSERCKLEFASVALILSTSMGCRFLVDNDDKDVGDGRFLSFRDTTVPREGIERDNVAFNVVDTVVTFLVVSSQLTLSPVGVAALSPFACKDEALEVSDEREASPMSLLLAVAFCFDLSISSS